MWWFETQPTTYVCEFQSLFVISSIYEEKKHTIWRDILISQFGPIFKNKCSKIINFNISIIMYVMNTLFQILYLNIHFFIESNQCQSCTLKKDSTWLIMIQLFHLIKKTNVKKKVFIILTILSFIIFNMVY